MATLTEIADLELQHTYFHNRLMAIEKNHGLDDFCSLCFKPVGKRGITDCPDCGGGVVRQETAFQLCKDLTVTIGADLRAAKVHPTMGTGIPTDPDEPVTIHLIDGNVTKYPSAKRARKWLRDHGLSVQDFTKKGNDWYYE